jgi:hypothetical protein
VRSRGASFHDRTCCGDIPSTKVAILEPAEQTAFAVIEPRLRIIFSRQLSAGLGMLDHRLHRGTRPLNQDFYIGMRSLVDPENLISKTLAYPLDSREIKRSHFEFVDSRQYSLGL